MFISTELLSAAVSNLDAAGGHRDDADQEINILVMRLSQVFARHSSFRTTKDVSKRDVRAALIAYGMSPFGVDMFANVVAHRVRQFGRFGV